MRRQGQGFSDKLYWRYFHGLWHCLKKTRKADGYEYRSLCQNVALPPGRLCGQDCRRPRPELRCGICDGKEADRRGWEESGPTLYPKPGGLELVVKKVKDAILVIFLVLLVGCPQADTKLVEPDPRAKWEAVTPYIKRMSTPQGWIVRESGEIVYVPDPEHEWLAPKPEVPGE